MDPHHLKYTKNSDHSFQLASVELKHQSGCALCWIHSMVVVTSPIGLHAPPALADTTTRPPQACRHSCPESKSVLGRFRNLPIMKTSGGRIAGQGNQDCSTQLRSTALWQNPNSYQEAVRHHTLQDLHTNDCGLRSAIGNGPSSGEVICFQGRL